MKKYNNLIINKSINFLKNHKKKEVVQPLQLTLWDWVITKNKQVKKTSNDEVSND